MPGRTRARSPPRTRAATRIRKARVGDLGWSFERQAVVYAQEFGYLPIFETYLAQGLAPYLESFDDRLDRLWVAELAGRRVGCIAIQHDAKRSGWAKLRWFFLEREARGKGLGRQLMRAAVTFSRRAGYEGIALWTVDDLADARRVYERSGFTLAFEDAMPCAWAPWGHEQRWELPLAPRSKRPGGDARPAGPTRGRAPSREDGPGRTRRRRSRPAARV